MIDPTSPRQPKFLIIRRDNIGDLVCTTPLIHALRQHFPLAWIAAWVNTYNAPVLQDNTDLNAVYAYEKAKHRRSANFLNSYWQRLLLLWRLRRQHLDYIILAGPAGHRKSLWWAQLIGAKHIIGHVKPEFQPQAIDMPVPFGDDKNRHEVENVFMLGKPLGIFGPPPRLNITNPDQSADNKGLSGQPVKDYRNPLNIGLHLSSRKASQRWPVAHYAELAQRLGTAKIALQFYVFWSPGAVDAPGHPGDDHKAVEFGQLTTNLPVQLSPTEHLADLIHGLRQCDLLICSDGGAMHIAAALGLPIVCLFGQSDPQRWHPWGVPFELLQPTSRSVADLSVEAVMMATYRLLSKLGAAPAPLIGNPESTV